MSLFINIPKESLSLEMLVAGKVKRRSKLREEIFGFSNLNRTEERVSRLLKPSVNIQAQEYQIV